MGDFLRERLEAAENLPLGAFGSVCEPSSGSLWAPLGTSARLPLGDCGSLSLPIGSLWEHSSARSLWEPLGASWNLPLGTSGCLWGPSFGRAWEPLGAFF